jgi:hypothetical protein
MKFSKANSKLRKLYAHAGLDKWLAKRKRKVYSFDLLSGHSCPFAERCLSKAVQTDKGRRIKDGPNTEFRCFSASQEVLLNGVYNLRKSNFDSVRGKSRDDILSLLMAHLPSDLGVCRIHVAGDFFNQAYFDAWMFLAKLCPDRLFYAYTKALPVWLARAEELPDNFVLTASDGGTHDHLIKENRLRQAIVVYSEAQAAKLGLDIDNDDSHAADPVLRNQSFSLLLHGTQPKGSAGARIVDKQRKGKI